MAARDPETGQFVEGASTDDMADYSDFSYQHVGFEIVDNDTATNNSRVEAAVDVEPLQGSGGLDQNEVAELVYLEVQASLEFESEDNQSASTTTELRGVLGSNLPPTETIEVQSGAPDETGTIIETRGTASDFSFTAKTDVEDRIFQQFRIDGAPPYDDPADGTGGGASQPFASYEKPWRSLTGRGPVLDSTDDVGVVAVMASADSVIETKGNIRAHMVWDTAEVSDAGRAFSVPR